MRSIVVVTAACLASPSMASSVFDGTWRNDLQTARMSDKPVVVLLQDGTFACKNCAPPYAVKADGQDHPVVGLPYADTIAVTVLDPNRVRRVNKKAGRLMMEADYTVAPDGQSYKVSFTDHTATSGTPVSVVETATRVAPAPAGSAAISGTWRATSFAASENGLITTLKLDGDMLTMSTPIGASYSARLGGPDASYKGDPGITSVSVRRIGDNVIEETDKRDGKVITVTRMTASADGKVLDIDIDDKFNGEKYGTKAMKQ